MKNFLSISPKYSNYGTSKAVILSFPYEKTVTYMRGCERGPKAIIKASSHVELYDEQFNVKPHTVGISTIGPPKFTNSHIGNIKIIEEEFLKYFDEGKFVVSLGGEHSITIGLVRGACKRIENLSVLQFDAHCDLRNSYEGNKYSHACTMRRILETTDHVSQVGIRSLSEREATFIKKNHLNPIFAWEFQNQTDKFILDRIYEDLSENVYLTIDVDYFSLDIVRDTGTPEPGGPNWYRTLNILKEIFKRKNVIAMDIVELSGGKGSEVSAYSMAVLIKKCLVYKFFT